MITITTDATVTNLTTVERVRRHVGGVDAADAAAAVAMGTDISAASSWIDAYLETRLARGPYAEVFLLSQASVSLVPTYLAQLTVLHLTHAGQSVSHSVGPSGLIWASEGRLFEPGLSYKLDYEAGYPAQGAVVACPPDIEEACVILAGHMWQSRGHHPDITAESLDGVASASFETPQLPQVALQLLAPYRTWRL